MAVLNRRTLLRALAWTAPTLAIGGLVPVANAEKDPKRRFMPKVYGTPIIGGLDPMGPSPLTLLRDNTDVLIDNTVTETALFTYTIPGYTLDGDRGLRVRIDAARITSGGGATVTIRVKLGATTLVTLTDTMSFSANPKETTFEFEVVAKNSDAEQEGFVRAGGMTVSPEVRHVYGQSTEDGTTDLDLVVTVEMSAAATDTSWLHRRSIVELL